jgi:MFS family permease
MPRLPAAVKALGAVSLLTDVSSEMIYPLLPAFVTGTLRAGPAVLGAIEGLAEATASLVKLASGRLSDRLPRRKPLVVAGYALSSLARPLVALATGAGHVLAIRLTDRLGKGVRGAPRDAIVAAVTPPALRGRAYGFQRAMDHTGAFAGPLIATALLALGFELRTVFALAAVPGLAAVVVLVLAVREDPQGGQRAPAADAPDRSAAGGGSSAQPGNAGMAGAWAGGTGEMLVATGAGLAGPEPATPATAPALPPSFRAYLVVLALFTLGNSSDAFLLLRAQQTGVGLWAIPLLWAFHHLVKALASTHGGALSDRLGRKPAIAAGFLVYALAYAGFAWATSPLQVFALFALYGLHHALCEGPERALVADLAADGARGRAFGAYHAVTGAMLLPASLLTGGLWQAFGAQAALLTGAALAGAAAIGLMVLVREANAGHGSH